MVKAILWLDQLKPYIRTSLKTLALSARVIAKLLCIIQLVIIVLVLCDDARPGKN